jgi:hypothetical protein
VNPDDDAAMPDDPAMIQSTFAQYGKNNVKDFFQTGTIYKMVLQQVSVTKTVT